MAHDTASVDSAGVIRIPRRLSEDAGGVALDGLVVGDRMAGGEEDLRVGEVLEYADVRLVEFDHVGVRLEFAFGERSAEGDHQRLQGAGAA